MIRKILLTALALVLVVPGSILLIEHLRGKSRLAATLADLRARGEVLDIMQIAPAPVPPSSNAMAELILAARRLQLEPKLIPPSLEMIGPARAIPGSRMDSWGVEERRGTYATWTEVAMWLTNQAAAFDDLYAALEAPYRQPILDYRQGFNLLLPHLSQMKAAVMALGVSAADSAHRGDLDGAMVDLKAMQRIERDLAGDPLLIDQLVRVACAGIATQRAWDILHAREWSDAQLALLQAVLPLTDLTDGIVHALEGERALVLTGIRAMGSRALWELTQGMNGTGNAPSGTRILVDGIRGAPSSLWRFGWGDQALVHYLKSMQAVVEVNRETAREKSSLPLRSFSSEALRENSSTWERLRSVYTRTLLPALEKAASKALRGDTERALLVTGLALRRYQLRNARLPDRLEALVPEYLAAVPVDHMDGQPLRYRREADGSFTLWSIGEDLIDNGGDATLPASRSGKDRWWTARDAVWPQRASEEEIDAWRQRQAEAVSKALARRANRAQPTNQFRLSPEMLQRYGLEPASPPPQTP